MSAGADLWQPVRINFPPALQFNISGWKTNRSKSAGRAELLMK
jgi:hypothetical protein